MTRLLSFFFLLIIPVLTLAADVKEYRLANGFKLLVKEDHRAPIVVSQIWYKVGSSYEQGGITGVSHALEHMMFRGTHKYGPGVLEHLVAENGGQQNAFTNVDFTAYYQVFDSSKLALSFELETDRMRNLLLRPEDFSKEIEVVMEERRMRTEDNPHQQTMERFLAAANVASPYHHPVVGWMDDLKNMTIEDLRAWYQHWYVPNNAIAVVVGDVKAEEVYQLAQKYFGVIQPSTLPVIKPQREVKPLGEKSVIVQVPAELPWLVLGYNVPVIKTATEVWEPYALEVVAALLDGGASARFAKNLIRGQQIAATTTVMYNPYSRLSDIFVLAGIPAQGHSVDQLKVALLEQVKQLQTAPVEASELARIKAQIIAHKVYDKDSIAEQATELGMLAAVDLPWQLADAYVAKISAITPQQILMVARKYLVAERLTVAELKPLALSKKTHVQPMMSVGTSQLH